MVENFTTENEVKNIETEVKISDEDVEQQLKLQLPKIMMNPSDSCIDRILNYSKSVVNKKA
ncbi:MULTISPECIES: hypothetical protein [Sphingobacterium]|jgi:hypothetical protein|uniref:Uncharacterized protein n=2 Tax=Sphingobacterium TaxID=28453 RepID=A0ABW5Z1W0_9SPHI|nr:MULTISPECIES: hypothetical protein [Sphingobacterium]MBB2953009.1 hypothetical protein [Sphingobacterium sp. JUb56]MCS3555112.1 hypothetical protein [Sphingobacterium sp. JUb21]MCW2261451.1 hypothetical protein [Sphingobacterium kitahiroshimense]NJI75197.1 hypothetical protein [Sphingobacterium sp. B16(2022)]QQD14750.1 hypothetical protein JAZ75_04230 [Sphingobacterium sp. UDSM-2020]